VGDHVRPNSFGPILGDLRRLPYQHALLEYARNVLGLSAAALGKMAVSSSVYALVQRKTREPIWPKVNAILWKTAAIAVIVCLVVIFGPIEHGGTPRRTASRQPL
jgi:hypothetical protein